eukprot:7201427-Pyramimonas_sp.AAC.2
MVKASTTSRAETKARAPQEERPGLQWATCGRKQIMGSRVKTAVIIETPHGLQLLTESPFARVHKEKQTTSTAMDECQHGANDADGRELPNKMTTILD